MERETVELVVGGQHYRVVSTAPPAELQQLADFVNARLADVAPAGKSAGPQAMLLTALALAHDLGAEREQRAQLERRTRDLLRRALVRIDNAFEPLESSEDVTAAE